tara:strand:- start:276 stop:1265 length:990 start_codon:yes stop_codon:yes gene_type:complete
MAINPKSGKSPARTPALIAQMDAEFKANNKLFGLADIRTKDYLAYSYTKPEQDREFELVDKKPGDISSKQCSNKIVLTNQPHFYETEAKMWLDNKDNLRHTLVSNRKTHLDKFKNEYQLNDKEVLRGFKISGKHVGFSHFNPLWARWFIEEYDIKTLYDPCGGWGHRLLGVANRIDKYIYNDFDSRTVDGCKQIAINHGITNAVFYNKDSASFIPKEKYSCVFTCPPYYNIETYKDTTFKNLDDYKQWWNNTVKHSLKDDVKTFAYVINHTHYDSLKEICESHGLVFKDKHEVGKALGHFSRSGKDPKKVEYLVVFENGQSTIKRIQKP